MKKNNFFLKCKDYLVTGEFFELHYNEEYDLLETFPKISEDKIDKYYQSQEYISHTSKATTLVDVIYKIVRSFTLQKKVSLINKFRGETNRVLDVGCGTGSFLKTCTKNNWECYGVEPSKNARNLAKESGDMLLYSSLEDVQDIKFDVITLWHVLEHVPDVIEVISKLKNLLAHDGRIIIAVPNYKSFDAIYYKEYWAAFDVPRHRWHFSTNSIQKLVDEHNCEVESIMPMKWDAYYISMLSEKNKKNKFGLFKAFFIGLTSNYKARSTNEYSSLQYIIKNKV